MLIASPRHREKDLSIWRELEEADRLAGIAPERVRRSLDSIRTFLAGGRAYVGVSWGKESVCTAHLVRCVDPQVPLINLRCTNRNPDCDAVRDAYLARYPSVYQEIPVDYGNLHARNLPHQVLDQLTDERWNAAIRVAGSEYGGRHILGVRAAESTGRRIRCQRWGENSLTGCAPLAWWTTADVFGYLARHDLPVHPVYAMLGGGRWPRERLRTAEIGDTHGGGSGRREWEREYYGDFLRRLEAGRRPEAFPD